jgi:signal transduction histidine kinase
MHLRPLFMLGHVKRRILLFAVALAAATTIFAWAATVAWNTARQFSIQFSEDVIHSFTVADEFMGYLRQLENLLLKAELQHDDASARQFEISRGELDHWLTQQRSRVYSAPERQRVQELDIAFNRYSRDALEMLARIRAGAAPVELQEWRRKVEAAGMELNALDRQLLDAHRAAIDQSVASSKSRFRLRQSILLGSISACVLLSLSLAVFVWRDLIQPLRRQLVESKELLQRQEKLAALGVLAAGVAHEIRNPLTAIKARLYTQRRSLPTDSPAARHGEIIHGEILRLERIVRDFLDFARPAEPNPTGVEAQALLQELRELLQPAWDKDGIQLEVEPGPSVTFEADRAQLGQVLINLARNAAEAGGAGSKVQLRARADELPIRGESQAVVVLEVSDQGPGIPLEARPRLFDPFYTTKSDGTGLGLSIAARIMEKHGGLLEYQSQIGLGTTFGIILPRRWNPLSVRPSSPS